MPFLVFRRDHCGSGSFAVQFGDHFWSGDHLRSGIICGAVQFSLVSIRFGSCEVRRLNLALALIFPENITKFLFNIETCSAALSNSE